MECVMELDPNYFSMYNSWPYCAYKSYILKLYRNKLEIN